MVSNPLKNLQKLRESVSFNLSIYIPVKFKKFAKSKLVQKLAQYYTYMMYTFCRLHSSTLYYQLISLSLSLFILLLLPHLTSMIFLHVHYMHVCRLWKSWTLMPWRWSCKMAPCRRSSCPVCVDLARMSVLLYSCRPHLLHRCLS